MASVRKRAWTHGGVSNEAWVVNYTDQGGKRRLKTFRTKKEADRYRTQVESELSSLMHTPASCSVKVGSLIDEYLTGLESRHREGRGVGLAYLNLQAGALRNYAEPVMGNVLVKDVDFANIEQMATTMAAGRVNCQPGEPIAERSHRLRAKPKALSPRTIYAHLHTLKLVFDFAMRRRYVARNVVAEVLKERGFSGNRQVIRLFSREDVVRLLQTVDNRPASFRRRAWALLRLHVHLGAFCGMRLGEIGGLTLSDVDFAAGSIRIRHSLTIYNEHKAPKSAAGKRTVPLPQHIALMLREWIGEHHVPNERDLIFTKGTERALQATFRDHWYRLLIRAGLPPTAKEGHLHFHSLRHFYTSALIDQGLPVTDVARLLGHSATHMTLSVYAHAMDNEERQAAAVATLAAALYDAPSFKTAVIGAT